MGAQIIAFPRAGRASGKARPIAEIIPVLGKVARLAAEKKPERLTSKTALDRMAANAKRDGRKFEIGAFVPVIATAQAIERLANLAGDNPKTAAALDDALRCLVQMEAAYA